MVIDLREGTAYIRGPATREEKATWDRFLARRADFEEEVAELEEVLEAETDPKMRRVISDDLAQTQRLIGIIDTVLSREPLRG